MMTRQEAIKLLQMILVNHAMESKDFLECLILDAAIQILKEREEDESRSEDTI